MKVFIALFVSFMVARCDPIEHKPLKSRSPAWEGNLSCRRFIAWRCGIHLWECENGKEYFCVTNLELQKQEEK